MGCLGLVVEVQCTWHLGLRSGVGAVRLRLSLQVKTLLLNAAQDTMALPLTPPSPAGELSPLIPRPSPCSQRSFSLAL